MDTRRFVDPTPDWSDGVSRRDVLLGVSVGGLAAGMLAHGFASARAQEATPSTGGLPPGVEIAPLIGAAPLDELPAAPAELHVYRLTIAPGVYFPPAPTPGPETVLVESGVLTCRCGAEGHPCSVLRADGTQEEQPIDQDFDLNPGDVLLQPANVPDAAGNNGTEPLVLLIVDIFPAAGMGTPTA